MRAQVSFGDGEQPLIDQDLPARRSGGRLTVHRADRAVAQAPDDSLQCHTLDPGGPDIEDLDILVVIESYIDPAAVIFHNHAKRRSGSRRPPDQRTRDKTGLIVHYASDGPGGQMTGFGPLLAAIGSYCCSPAQQEDNWPCPAPRPEC